ncbi:ParB/RepB/Spo0J family partition protein [Micromonospora olivasterospora]|uniref:ParB family chromosome partitioning protein n=1 Tax=Micromonospora olivasterospora TaxID=1880 RepID=A0A562HVF0_MICOL|nr:ParB/RepB/Spo0J family partition protein [Micromonospora olivasterospora]TWH62293.1 ParB family chromosome partitioning protein [Micromonospora olivasterospora]
MAGKRVNLSDLATEPALPEARVPAFAESAPRTARVQQVAANPLNTRDLDADHAKIGSIADSMRTHGQLQPCAVVSREAFLRIYPEHEAAIGRATWVQVTGGRRRAAALLANQPTLDIIVKNSLAESREAWVSATAAENLDRENLDPIEEARAIQLLVQECGTGKAAAERLSRTPAWVTQRLNLLKLAPELQALLRSGEVPLRDVRDLHQLPLAEQLEELRQRQQPPAEPPLTAVNRAPVTSETLPSSGATSERRPRKSAAASAIRRLGGTPDKVAESLRAEMTPEDLRTLANLLLTE